VKSEHIQPAMIKSYLLGMLPEQEASVIEERYFTETAFFDRIRGIEMDIVCEFLEGTLTAEEREHFNRRCLQSPRLMKLVNEVKSGRETERIASKPLSAMWIAARFRALCALVIKILGPEKLTKEKPKE